MKENKTRFYELILDCPYCFPLSDCLFDRYRKMSICELIEASRHLDAAATKSLIDQHEECIKKRKLNKIAS